MSDSDCEAVCWHGPGHQTKTPCDGPRTHEQTEDGEVIHVARRRYSADLMWTGIKGYTGFFDENKVEIY